MVQHDRMASVIDKICGRISIIILVLFEGAESAFCVCLNSWKFQYFQSFSINSNP